MEFKESQTYKNLSGAFAGESMARNKYNFYASKAKKDGYEQIAEIFEKTANNEKEHAKLWYKLIHDGVGSTIENLLLAAQGENEEWTGMYKEYAKTARKEGFVKIAEMFEGVAKIEAEHEKRFRQLLDNINKDKVFIKNKVIIWECRNCGHRHVGATAPDVCPVCDHPKAYFEELCENYLG